MENIQKKVKIFVGTYSRTSTLVVCIHHDLRTEKVQHVTQTSLPLLQHPQVEETW